MSLYHCAAVPGMRVQRVGGVCLGVPVWDRMLHGVRFSKGSAAYVNRYVKTHRLRQEDAYGRPLFIKVGTSTHIRSAWA